MANVVSLAFKIKRILPGNLLDTLAAGKTILVWVSLSNTYFFPKLLTSSLV